MSILPLPEAVVAQIKSSLVVTSLNQVACGLVKNSLDAASTKIHLSVDYTRGSCSAEDNGAGILPSEFGDGGGLGKPYYTSKYPPTSDVHGRRGEFLAATASLSLLSITSRHKDKRSHNSLQLHNSAVIARNTPALPENRILTFDHGTRVTVRDLFGSMPVRVLRRPSASDATRDWLALVHDVSGIVLTWPSAAMVRLRCSATNRVVVLRSGENASRSVSRQALELPSRVPRVLWQAGIIDTPERDGWVPLTAKSNGVAVSGCISLVPSASKKCQFISLGLEPVHNERGTNVLYEQINRSFTNSGFGMEEADEPSEEEKLRRAKDRRYKRDGYANSALKAKKGVDRWPMFFLRIRLDEGLVDVEDALDERRPTLHVITDLLRATIFEFLKKNYFRPRRLPARHGGEPLASPATGTTKRTKKEDPAQKRSGSPFDVWRMVKSGQPGLRPKSAPALDASAHSRAGGPKTGLVEWCDESLQSPLVVDEPRTLSSLSREPPAERDDAITWRNPETNVVSVVDKRTGFVRPSSAQATRPPVSRLTSSSSVQDPNPNPAASSPWIDEILASFKNPVFENPTEPPIPTLFGLEDSLDGRNGPEPPRWSPFNHCYSTGCSGLPEVDVASTFKTATSMLDSRVSRASLRNAEVISQVNEKFILARVRASRSTGEVASSEAGDLLVIVDQHAADERRRVEALMQAYHDHTGRAMAVPLDPGVHFDVPDLEAELFRRFRENFLRWGVHYEVTCAGDSEGTGTKTSSVVVVGLPPSISERCNAEPQLLIQLLRRELYLMDEGQASSGTVWRDREPSDRDWVSRFHGCPKGILELINSRACRSAIMFNDPLSKEECRELLRDLAECAFPFQCAHGRPSMVPLIGLGGASTESGHGDRPLTGDWSEMLFDEQLSCCEMVAGD